MAERATVADTISEPKRSPAKANSSVTIVKLSSVHEAGLLLPLVRAWHAESIYRHLLFSERKFLVAFTKALQRGPAGATYYALLGGKATGVIDIAVGEAWLSEGGCYATCLAWFVHPQLRGKLVGGRIAMHLLKAASQYSSQQGATNMYISGTHGSNRVLPKLGNILGQNISMSIKQK